MTNVFIKKGEERERNRFIKSKRKGDREINAYSRQHEREGDVDYGYFSFAASSQTNKPIIKSQQGN